MTQLERKQEVDPEATHEKQSSLDIPATIDMTKHSATVGEGLVPQNTPKTPDNGPNIPVDHIGNPESQEPNKETFLAITKIQEELSKLENVETVRDLRSLDPATLISLENKFEGILLYAFTDIVGSSTKIDFANWETYKKPQAGMRFHVNFLGNPNAEMEIGAADILPPCIRGITVYDQGDQNSARTSERRVGLKGLNVPESGFFDSNGYIPVFSGDVIEIQAPDEAFLKDYPGPLTEEDYKKYMESETGKKDTGYTEELFRKNPQAQKDKIMTTEEIDSLSSKINASGVSQRVAQTTLEIGGGRLYNPKHCWDWCEHVYKAAGAKRHTIYKSPPYEGHDCGSCHAGPELVSRITPGDWLFINNKNTSDDHGNHSVIFLGWIDHDNLIARVGSGSAKKPGCIHKTNLAKNQVTAIFKPMAIAG